jgi:hypothetical protein
MTRLTRLAAPLVACVVALAVAPPARAGLLPVSVTIHPEEGNFRWTYAIVLPTDSQLRSGDYFTVYDFGGLVSGGNEQPAGWALTIQHSGPVYPGADPHDDAGIANLTWTYTGPTIPTGQLGLGNFWAVSQFGQTDESFFTARTHTTADGRIDTNITETIVPIPSDNPNLVPEPGTLALAGLGLPLVGLAHCLRRRK